MLAYQSVRRLIVLLKELGISIIGVVENMVMKPSSFVESKVNGLGLKYLGSIDYDQILEPALGDVQKILETNFYKKLGEIGLIL